jgi:hypothetical protein
VDVMQLHTVTRPYTGFRHPDRMAPDQTVSEKSFMAYSKSAQFQCESPRLQGKPLRPRGEHGGQDPDHFIPTGGAEDSASY